MASIAHTFPLKDTQRKWPSCQARDPETNVVNIPMRPSGTCPTTQREDTNPRPLSPLWQSHSERGHQCPATVPTPLGSPSERIPVLSHRPHSLRVTQREDTSPQPQSPLWQSHPERGHQSPATVPTPTGLVLLIFLSSSFLRLLRPRCFSQLPRWFQDVAWAENHCSVKLSGSQELSTGSQWMTALQPGLRCPESKFFKAPPSPSLPHSDGGTRLTISHDLSIYSQNFSQIANINI